MSLAALLGKDLLRERRGREALQAGLVLVLVFALAFLFAVPSLAGVPDVAALVLWLPMLFGGIATAGRTFAAEAHGSVLPWLRSAPVPLGLHGIARTALAALLVAFLAAASLLVAWLTWGIAVRPSLLLVLLLGAAGIAVVATITGALAAQARARDLLLPVLAVPVLAPLLQAGLAATALAIEGRPTADMATELLLLVGYDAVALGVAWILWPLALEGD